MAINPLRSISSNRAWVKWWDPVVALTVPKAEMCSPVETQAVANLIIKSVLSNMRLIARIAETVGKMLGRSVYEHYLCKMEEASTKSADIEPWIVGLLSRTRRP